MRYLYLITVCLGLMLGAVACKDTDQTADSGTDSGTKRDSGMMMTADGGMMMTEDGGTDLDGGVTPGTLERPPVLPRPPAGRLPDDLRPPR